MFSMRLALTFTAIAAMVSLPLLPARAAEESGQRWDFGEASGTLPAWLLAPTGSWEIRDAPDAPSGKRALFQKGKGAGAPYNLAVVAETRLKDLTLTAYLKAVAGEEDQGGGLVWRYRDPGNYYVARFNPLEDNYRVYKVVNGSRRELGSARVKPGPGWHRLDVRMTGSRITCGLDGKTYLNVEDGTFPAAGAVGVWSKADAQTLFAGLEAHALR